MPLHKKNPSLQLVSSVFKKNKKILNSTQQNCLPNADETFSEDMTSYEFARICGISVIDEEDEIETKLNQFYYLNSSTNNASINENSINFNTGTVSATVRSTLKSQRISILDPSIFIPLDHYSRTRSQSAPVLSVSSTVNFEATQLTYPVETIPSHFGSSYSLSNRCSVTETSKGRFVVKSVNKSTAGPINSRFTVTKFDELEFVKSHTTSSVDSAVEI
ncbi:hypothetical protein HDU92_000344 [Lobulomyces angularis]|nr:hypothetical protein HDU92_000344 [Lobulomyces angularis]